jgi:hypothetical protein
MKDHHHRYHHHYYCCRCCCEEEGGGVEVNMQSRPMIIETDFCLVRSEMNMPEVVENAVT